MTLAQTCIALCLMTVLGCSKSMPDEGPLTGTSNTMAVTGEYKRSTLDSVERMTMEDGKLVLHGPSGTQTLALPPNADPEQQNKGWALVTEGNVDNTRTLTFTHETSLDDFTLTLPPAEGQVAYGSVGGRDGNDVLLFAYGSESKTYWGWATIAKRATAAQ